METALVFIDSAASLYAFPEDETVVLLASARLVSVARVELALLKSVSPLPPDFVMVAIPLVLLDVCSDTIGRFAFVMSVVLSGSVGTTRKGNTVSVTVMIRGPGLVPLSPTLSLLEVLVEALVETVKDED